MLWLRSDDLTQPIVAWLRSVREGRSADLPRVLSTRVRRALGPISWEALCAYYATSWGEQLGTAQWQPEDFLFVGTVQYAGTDRRAAADPQTMDRAEVRLRFLVENGVPKDLRVNVVREGQAWFVDEFPSGFTAR